MPLPIDNLTTAFLDAATDDPSQARAELLNAINKLKEIMAALPLYADGSQNGTGTQRLNRLKIGPEAIPAWSSTWRVIDLGNRSGFYEQGTGITGIANNTYYDGTNWRARVTGPAIIFECATSGDVALHTAPSTAANGIVTFTERLRITNSGVMNIGAPASGYARVGPGMFRIITATLIGLPFGAGVNIPAPAGATGLIVSLWCSARSANAPGVRFSSVVAYDATGANICGNATARGTELTAAVGATICENYTEMVIPVSGGVARVMFNSRDGGNNSTAGYAIVGYTI